jgi:hypothetical protein
MWLEKTFWGFETFLAYFYYAAVGEGVIFYEDGSVFCEFIVEFEVITDVAKFFFDLTDSFKVGCSVEGVTATKEEFDELTGDITTCHVETSSFLLNSTKRIYVR